MFASRLVVLLLTRMLTSNMCEKFFIKPLELLISHLNNRSHPSGLMALRLSSLAVCFPFLFTLCFKNVYCGAVPVSGVYFRSV